MSSSSASSSGTHPSQAPAGLPGGVKGDNPEGDQEGGHSIVNQPQPSQSVNKPQPSQSVNKAYSHGPSSQRQAADQMKDDGQEGGAQGDRNLSVPDFHNLDFPGHFKIKLQSRKYKHSVLKLKVKEEQFVKFCHLFHCELQLEALKQALLSDLKVDVTGDGYPPSICPQEGASDPIDTSMNRVLTILCCQLNAVNISSTSWNTDQVKNTLFLLDSYHKGIVIGYEVSGDVTNCWLVGECGAIKTIMEALGQLLGPFRYQQTDQQEPNEKETTSDRAETTPGDVLSYRGDMLHSGGSHESDNGQTGQTGSDKGQTRLDNRQTAQTNSDNRQTGKSGSDNRQTGQTGSDNRQAGQTGSDNRQTAQTDSDNKQTGQTVSDNRQPGQSGSDNRQTGQTGSDNRQTGQTRSDNRQTGQTVSDNRQPGQTGSDNRQTPQTDLDNRQTRQSGSDKGQTGQPGSDNRQTGQTGSDNKQTGQTGSDNKQTGQTGSDNKQTGQSGSDRQTRQTDLDRKKRPSGVNEDMGQSGSESKPLKQLESNSRCQGFPESGDRGSEQTGSSQSETDNITGKHISGDKDQIEKDRVDLSSVMKPEQMSMLRVSGVLDYVKDHIKRKGISCHLEQDKDTTRVYATQDYMSDILNEIQVAIFCQEFEIDSTWRLFVDSPYAQQEMCNLQKNYNDKVTITVTESLVIIVCTSDISEHVLESMTKMKADFLEVKTKSLRYTPEGNLTIELCAKVLHDQFNSAREKYGVEISPIRNHDKQGWIVKGPAGTLEEACEDVKKRTAKVVSESVHLKDKVCKGFFESKPGQDVMLRVGEDTGTIVTIEKKEVSMVEEKHLRNERSGSTRQQTPSLPGHQWRSGEGPYVALYCGDGRESPDNIVVELKTGDPTSGVKLPPHDDKQYVVTLTIPKWREGVNKEKHTIQTMFKDIITAAAERKVNSLTILLDSCRNSGWDGKKACKLLVKNTLYVLKHDNAVACSCSYFTGDQEKFKLIRNIIDESFNDDKSVTIKDKGKEIDDYEVIDGSEAERKPHLVKGELARMTSEVIVNTTRTDLKLDQGAVSLSILKAAGREIQQCCNQYYSGVKHGEVAVTYGYKLKCTYVFHGALPHYSAERMNRMEVMEQFMRNCLKEADKRNCKTISFPALGTGNLGYPKDLVAHTMFDTVKKYFQENPDSCVEGVNFVVYPKDRDTIKAFEDEDRKPKAMLPVLPSEKTGVQLRIGTVDLWVTLGQIERSKAESLLIFWDNSSLYKNSSTFYFNEGLNPTGFQDLKRNRTSKMMKGETVITEAGTLHFGTIIHCPITIGNAVKLKNVMNALKVADDMNFPSLAISLGRKEQWTRFKETIVTLFYDALRQCEGRYKTLRSVEIIFDDPDIYKSVESHIRSTYSDKVVGNYSNTGADVTGATGGVGRQRDDNYNRSTGQPTAMAEETHLVVVSQTGDNMDKAIRQLQNKITELQRQPPDRPPPPSSTQTPPPYRRKEQSGPKSPSPTVDTKDDASVVLTRTEYEKRRLIVTSNSQSALDKKRIEDWLENTTGILIHTTGHNIPMIKVVYPFREDTEALIIFESVKDAEKLMKQQGNDKYLPTKFPKQTVQNVKAKLKSEIVRAIHTQVNRNDIVSVIYDASGATWLDDRGTSYLTGSLPEIQCAYRYIVRIITNVNRDDMFNDGRRQDDSGDFHDDARGYHRPTSQDNNTQSRRPNGDGNDQGENRNAATGVTKQVISHLDAEQEQNNSSSYPDTVNQTNPGQRQSTVTEFSKNAPKSKLKGQTNPNVEAPVGTQNPSAQQEELRSKVETNSINNWNSGELKKTFFNEKQGNVPFRDTRRLKIDNKGPLDTEDSVPEVDNIDFDNISEKGVRSIPRNDGRPDHIRKGSDEADRIRSVTCSSDQFYEVVFFNPEIDKEMDTKCNDSRTEFYVSNPSQRFMKAINKLNNYARREISNLTDIEDNKFKVYHQQEKDNMDILCVYNPSLKQIKIVGEKFDVVEQTERLILQNIGRPYQHSNHHTAGKRKRIKSPSDTKVFLTKGEVQVLMYQGDLLNLDVDVIVHGTNVSLDNPKGQSAGIAEAAGSEFEAACDNIYRTRTLNVTDCCYTTAGNLPYDCIIHAVVPMWNAYKKTSKIPREMRSIFQDDLCKTIMNALEEAVNVGAMSVGLPVFGYGDCPTDIYKAAFTEALNLSCEKYQNTSLKQVHVVDKHHEPLNIIQHQTKEMEVPGSSREKHKHHDVRAQHVCAEYPKWKKRSDFGGTCMLSQKLEVKIIKGTYTKTRTSALVSIEDEMLQSKRYVATEIAKVAGEQYKTEINKLRNQKKIKYMISNVLVTGAGNMQNATHVLHVIAPVADKDIVNNNELFKGFANSIRACLFEVLQKADDMKLDSVALPPFTSGTFQRGQTDLVWEICVDVIGKFAAKQSPKSAMKTIYIVGGSYDVQLLLQMFESKMSHFETSL